MMTKLIALSAAAALYIAATPPTPEDPPREAWCLAAAVSNVGTCPDGWVPDIDVKYIGSSTSELCPPMDVCEADVEVTISSSNNNMRIDDTNGAPCTKTEQTKTAKTEGCDTTEETTNVSVCHKHNCELKCLVNVTVVCSDCEAL